MAGAGLVPGRRSGWGATPPCSGSRSSPGIPPSRSWFWGRRRIPRRQQQRCSWEPGTIWCLDPVQALASSSATRRAATGPGLHRTAERCHWDACLQCTETSVCWIIQPPSVWCFEVPADTSGWPCLLGLQSSHTVASNSSRTGGHNSSTQETGWKLVSLGSKSYFWKEPGQEMPHSKDHISWLPHFRPVTQRHQLLQKLWKLNTSDSCWLSNFNNKIKMVSSTCMLQKMTFSLLPGVRVCSFFLGFELSPATTLELGLSLSIPIQLEFSLNKDCVNNLGFGI